MNNDVKTMVDMERYFREGMSSLGVNITPKEVYELMIVLGLGTMVQTKEKMESSPHHIRLAILQTFKEMYTLNLENPDANSLIIGRVKEVLGDISGS